MIFVDDWRQPARIGRHRGRWSHLATDSADLGELHAFAARIGLKRAWFQDKPGRPHYDVTDPKRTQAIAAGARPVSWRDLPAVLRRHRAAAENGGTR